MPLVQAVAEPVAASSTVVEQMHTWRSPYRIIFARWQGSSVSFSTVFVLEQDCNQFDTGCPRF